MPHSLPTTSSPLKELFNSDRKVAFAEKFLRHLMKPCEPPSASDPEELDDDQAEMSAFSIETLAFALRFAHLLGDAVAARRMHEDGSCTLVQVRPGRDLVLAMADLPRLLPRLRKFLGLRRKEDIRLVARVDASPRGASASERARQHQRFRQTQDEAISFGDPLLAVAADPSAFTSVARTICPAPLVMPPVSRALILELLRITHPETEERSWDALHDALPTDDALRRLDGPLLTPAFKAATAFDVAQRLMEYSAACAPKQVRALDRVQGLGPIRPQLDRLLAGFSNWQSGEADWSALNTSALISGPTGCGKTMLARAVAEELGVPLVATSYAECQKAGHLGQMLAALDEVVLEAILKTPCVLFIDEMDSFTSRGTNHQNSEYQRQVVNAMLLQLTRLAETPGVMVLAATNHPDVIDPALRRAGRLDLHLMMRYPDRAGLQAILRDTLGAPDLNVKRGADLLLGASGATAASVARSALGIARQQGRPISSEDIAHAAREVVPNAASAPLERIAIHEAGHLLAVFHLLPTMPTRAAIGPAGGSIEGADAPLLTESDIRAAIIVRLAGRAAEQALLGSASSGAGGSEYSDLAIATRLALEGMTQMGLFGSDLLWRPVRPDQHIALPASVDARVTEVLNEAQDAAMQLIMTYIEQVKQVAKLLLKRRELDADELRELRQKIRPSPQSQPV
ncbi:AAA family ATPase [Thioclava sp. JE_KL1]|uniref:AAA family ATPase n=1 Tax=Thioclava sp. JE_KL1 TaxID=2651187 RepID=UPI00128CCB44|nr:AAA family ATPase [Thioclava sp. JE_KL1]MPQ95454.1 AAA family ATPase [Thioclava sp. JE_KL1]